MSILITGSTGFIGSCFCQNKPEFTINKLDPSIRINSTCGSNSLLKKQLKKNNTVLHLAGLAHGSYTEQELNEVDHLGTLELAAAAAKAGVKRFVFISTVNVHGNMISIVPFTEISGLDNSVNLSKAKAEEGLKKIGKENSMEVTIIRSVLVYGKNAPGNFGLLSKIVSKLPFTPFALVKNKRSFISVGEIYIRHPYID